jgi:hypothetical protein
MSVFHRRDLAGGFGKERPTAEMITMSQSDSVTLNFSIASHKNPADSACRSANGK